VETRVGFAVVRLVAYRLVEPSQTGAVVIVDESRARPTVATRFGCAVIDLRLACASGIARHTVARIRENAVDACRAVLAWFGETVIVADDFTIVARKVGRAVACVGVDAIHTGAAKEARRGGALVQVILTGRAVKASQALAYPYFCIRVMTDATVLARVRAAGSDCRFAVRARVERVASAVGPDVRAVLVGVRSRAGRDTADGWIFAQREAVNGIAGTCARSSGGVVVLWVLWREMLLPDDASSIGPAGLLGAIDGTVLGAIVVAQKLGIHLLIAARQNVRGVICIALTRITKIDRRVDVRTQVAQVNVTHDRCIR
jgi:hypothetical protein